MQTSAARREEIQKRLQLLKDEREREQKAFDGLAAAHPELSVKELQELARKQAASTEPTGIEVAGAPVNVGEYVGVIDDPGLLLLAEQGHLVRDPVKRVYLGERGKVLRVMNSFQGKPAVELRFADGAEKVFFAECLDVGDQSSKKKATGRPSQSGKKELDDEATGRSATVKAGSGPAQQQKSAAADENATPKPSPAPMPGWNDLSLPHRGQRRSSEARSMSSSGVPSPPPTLSQVIDSSLSQDASVSEPPKATDSPRATTQRPSPSSPPVVPVTHRSASVAQSVPLEPPPTSAKKTAAPLAPEKKAAPSPAHSPAPANVREAVEKSPAPPTAPTPPAVAKAAPAITHPVPQRLQSVGLVKEALLETHSVCIVRVDEELGKPSEDLFAGSPSLRKPSMETENLAKTPRPDFLESVPVPRQVVPFPADESQVPKSCPAEYEAKFSLSDTSTHIPRYTPTKSISVRRCWIAGYVEGQQEPLEFKAMALRQNVDSLDAVLAAVSRALLWNAASAQRAQRLFTEEGVEIMWVEAIVNDMHLVATPGNTYSGERVPAAPAPPASTSVTAQSPPPPLSTATPSEPVKTTVVHRRAGSTTTKQSSAKPLTSPLASTGPRSPPADVHKNAGHSATGAQTQLVSRTVVSRGSATMSQTVGGPAGAAKTRQLMHIRVYENGSYDSEKYDRVYRTVTVRPTYKTLSSLKVLITRELEWRDGRKVDLLFDASGLEITSLEELEEGKCVVASAGDRFVVPFPNTALHREAMKLSQSL